MACVHVFLSSSSEIESDSNLDEHRALDAPTQWCSRTHKYISTRVLSELRDFITRTQNTRPTHKTCTHTTSCNEARIPHPSRARTQSVCVSVSSSITPSPAPYKSKTTTTTTHFPNVRPPARIPRQAWCVRRVCAIERVAENHRRHHNHRRRCHHHLHSIIVSVSSAAQHPHVITSSIEISACQCARRRYLQIQSCCRCCCCCLCRYVDVGCCAAVVDDRDCPGVSTRARLPVQ